MLIRALPVLTALASATVSLTSCGGQIGHGAPVRQADSARLRQMLVAELQHQAPALTGDIEAAAERLHTESARSSVLPGVEYHWAFFAPPRTFDVRMEALLGTQGENAIPLRTPSDWARLAVLAGWNPKSPNEAIAACMEIVSLTGPMRNFVVPPRLIDNSSVLMRRDVEGREQLANRISFPSVREVADGWEVRGWFLESGRTTLYSCTQTNSDVKLNELDTIVGAGLPTLGP